MSENFMIIKTKKMSPREVKKKLHDFIDGISEDCGPEIEQMADELKAHGDDFVDALSGNAGGASYRRARAWHRSDGGMNGGYRNGADYRSDGSWEERDALRKRNEKELLYLERKIQELKAHMREM